VIKVVGNIMKTNVAACSSIGSYFYPQIGRIYFDMLTMYRASSQLIDEAVQRDGEYDDPNLIASTNHFRANRDQDAQSSGSPHYQEGDIEAYQYLR
jgi:hypothetical protein